MSGVNTSVLVRPGGAAAAAAPCGAPDDKLFAFNTISGKMRPLDGEGAVVEGAPGKSAGGKGGGVAGGKDRGGKSEGKQRARRVMKT